MTVIVATRSDVHTNEGVSKLISSRRRAFDQAQELGQVVKVQAAVKRKKRK